MTLLTYSAIVGVGSGEAITSQNAKCAKPVYFYKWRFTSQICAGDCWLQIKRITFNHFKLKLNEVDWKYFLFTIINFYCWKQIKTIIESHGVQINTDPRKILILEENPSMGALWNVWENTFKNCHRKVFHHGQSTEELVNRNNNYQVSQCPNQYWSPEDL